MNSNDNWIRTAKYLRILWLYPRNTGNRKSVRKGRICIPAMGRSTRTRRQQKNGIEGVWSDNNIQKALRLNFNVINRFV